VSLVLQLISEVGTDMLRWKTEKHFTPWLGLAGGRQQSGKRKGRVKAHRNRAGRMFCAAARALAQSVDKALGGFYRRLRGRIGGLAANVALARKLAQLFYRLLRYGIEYVEQGLKAYETKVLKVKRVCCANWPVNKFILLPSPRKLSEGSWREHREVAKSCEMISQDFGARRVLERSRRCRMSADGNHGAHGLPAAQAKAAIRWARHRSPRPDGGEHGL
jgi:hypothetical protein